MPGLPTSVITAIASIPVPSRRRQSRISPCKMLLLRLDLPSTTASPESRPKFCTQIGHTVTRKWIAADPEF
jgi:hypothetical protein